MQAALEVAEEKGDTLGEEEEAAVVAASASSVSAATSQQGRNSIDNISPPSVKRVLFRDRRILQSTRQNTMIHFH